MPNIVEYNAQGEITPSDKGIQAAELAGRRIGAFGSQISQSLTGIGNQIEQHMSVMETSELYKTGTQLKLNLQQKYDQESALPENRNNPHFADQFMAEVGPQLDGWGSGATTLRGKELAGTLKANIRNDIFNHVAAGQSAMDTAHVEDNLNQTIYGLGASVASNPTTANLDTVLGTAKDAIQGITMSIPDVPTRERVAAEMTATRLPQLVVARYQGVAESIKEQVAQTGDVTQSAAYAQMGKDIAGQVGFQYLPPETQQKLSEVRDAAAQKGVEMYKAGTEVRKAQAVEQGKADYAQIDTAITGAIAAGQPLDPQMIGAIDSYAIMHGSTNPGEVHALNDARIRAQESAQNDRVQPYNPQAWADIQGRLSLPPSDPRAVTATSLLQAWGSHQITTEQLKLGQEMVKLQTENPGFKSAFESFKRWQSLEMQSIGNNSQSGTGAARAQFVHDSTVNFMAKGRAYGDWDKALNAETDANSPSSFNRMVKWYRDAAIYPDAAARLQHNGVPTFNPDGSITPAAGSKAAPIYPTASSPASAQPTKIDQKAVDAAIWGK